MSSIGFCDAQTDSDDDQHLEFSLAVVMVLWTKGGRITDFTHETANGRGRAGDGICMKFVS
jgi:hypothetical protein